MDRRRFVPSPEGLEGRTLLSVSGGWDVHVGILEDVLTNQRPRGFWSTHEKLEREYARMFPEK